MIALVQVVPDAKPPKELSAVDHAANAFASTSRANNLETIDFTVESLTVTGAAAPAFFLQTDDKGRRPVSTLVPPQCLLLFWIVKEGCAQREGI